eukprot:m.237545 g.237545  ORF g.237545 m.237545 type:complete len:138 (-) comp19372_c0_seq5:186-599(-)
MVPGTADAVVVSSSDSATLSYYVGNHCAHQITTANAPQSIAILDGDDVGCPLVVVAENEQLSVWDITRSTKPVVRQMVSKQLLHTIAVGTGRIYAAGVDRNVYVINARTWGLEGTWGTCHVALLFLCPIYRNSSADV